MTPQAFKTSWANPDQPLSPLSESLLNKYSLLKDTFDFLNTAGLPSYCEPNLSFANDTDDIVYGISKLTEQYDFEEDKLMFEKYIIIGSCRDGDAIAIDTGDNDKIVQLDHEDSFSSMYFNNSIETLADFLTLYRDFESEVSQGKDLDDNFRTFNFTDEQFEQLKSKMSLADSRALLERGFWKEELDIMLTIRQEKFPLNN